MGGIEQGHADVDRAAQQQRQLRPAEDQRLDSLLALHAARDGDIALARLGADDSVDELVQVGFVDELLVARAGDRDLDPFAREYLLVEPALHREARSEESHAPELAAEGRAASGL